MPNLSDPRPGSSRTTTIALVLSGCSLAGCGYLWLELRAERARAESAVCEDKIARGQLEQLRLMMQGMPGDASSPVALRQVMERMNVVEHAVRRLASNGTDVDPHPIPKADTVKIEVPKAAEKSVHVSETSPGNYAVLNSDPALAGQTMVVKRKAADGTEESVTIVVPPPEDPKKGK